MFSLWETVDDCGGRVVVLAGSAGSGKTSVFRALLQEAGATSEILVGTEWSREVPYALLSQMWTRDPLPLTGTDAPLRDRLRMAERLLDELRTEEAKRIIVIDDVHLADPESLQVFSQMARRLDSTRVLLVVAAADEASAEVDPDFLRMIADPAVERVTIPSFGRSDALELARSCGVHDIGEHGVTVLAGLSAGRLRVAQEILALLPDGRWPQDPDALTLPQTIVDEVMAPIEAADSADVHALAAALAILETPQEPSRVAEVADLSAPETAIDRGVAHGVFSEYSSAGRLTLRLCHAEAARVIRDGLAPSVRRRLHQRAADSAPREDERLVHSASAALGTDVELSDRLSASASIAEKFGRWADAAQLHFGAASVLPDSADRDSQLLSGIDALASAGKVTEVLPWLGIGKSIAPSTLRDTVLANVAIHRGQAAQADDLLTRAETMSTDDDELTAQIALRRTLDSLVRWDGPRLCEWANRAMSLSDIDEPAHVESRAMRALGFAAQGQVDEAVADLDDLGDRHISGAQNQRFRLCVGWVAMLSGDLREAVREFETAVPTQHERGSLRISLWARGWLARVQYLLGEWDEALRTAEEGLRQCDAANISLVAPLLHWTAAEIRLWRGQSVSDVVRRADSSSILSDYLAMQVPARMTRAIAANVRGDHDGRAAALRPLLDVDPWTERRVSFWPWCTEFVDSLIFLGQADKAEQAAKDFFDASREARAYPRALAEVAWARICQDKGDIAGAEAGFSSALALLRDGSYETEVARVLLSRGQMLRRVNRRRDAVENLVRAREFYEGVGASVLVQRCDQELRATGMSWRGMTETEDTRAPGETNGYAPLTPQELAVADLVVQGMTNAEVSRRLFIAEKTVQYHLTHIYGKFGIRSRTELATVHLSDDIPTV